MDITISSGVGATPLRGFPTDAFSFRAYSEKDYVTDTGAIVLAGSERENYRETTGGTLDATTKIPTYPALVLPATTNAADDQTSRWTVVIVDSTGRKRETYFESYQIPHALGTPITFETLVIHNEGTVATRDATNLIERLIPHIRSGSENLTAGVAVVVFSTPEVDAVYRVALSSSEEETVTVSGKSTAGFTITSDNGQSNSIVDWIIHRN